MTENTVDVDSAGNVCRDVDNLRITYVPAASREHAKNWAGQDVLRVQSYRGGDNAALHRGAEFPIESPDSFVALLSALCSVYNAGRRAGGDTGT